MIAQLAKGKLQALELERANLLEAIAARQAQLPVLDAQIASLKPLAAEPAPAPKPAPPAPK